MEKLSNTVAVITGGTSGIGLATAKLFIDEGARVVVTGRSEPALSEAKAALGSRSALVLRSDASKLADIEQLASEVKKRFSQIDILFVNAGIARFAAIEAVDERAFDEIFNTNLKGAFFTIQRMLPLLRDGGSIILNASIAGRVGIATSSVYAASKAALRSLARTLSAETAARNIRVNAISPGLITTPIYGKVGLEPEDVQNWGESMMQQVPLKRFGLAEEIARAVLFLASTDSSYILGSDLVVDGGMSQL